MPWPDANGHRGQDVSGFGPSAPGVASVVVPSVSLRPVRESDLEYFDLWGTPEADPFNFFGFRTPHRARRAFAENGLISAEGGMLLVLDGDGQVVGDVGWHAEEYGPGVQSRAYNI